MQSRSTNFSGSNIVNAFSAVAKKAIRKIKQVVGDMPSGISLHRLVVTLPVGVFCVVVFLDFFALVSWSESWALASFYTLGLGLIFALCALLTGLVAASKLGKESELRRAAFLHGLPMLIASLLFTFCWVGRLSEPSAISIWWFGLNLIAVFVLFYGLWSAVRVMAVRSSSEAKAAPESKTKAKVDGKLDYALDQTFPASDPISTGR